MHPREEEGGKPHRPYALRVPLTRTRTQRQAAPPRQIPACTFPLLFLVCRPPVPPRSSSMGLGTPPPPSQPPLPAHAPLEARRSLDPRGRHRYQDRRASCPACLGRVLVGVGVSTRDNNNSTNDAIATTTTNSADHCSLLHARVGGFRTD